MLRGYSVYVYIVNVCLCISEIYAFVHIHSFIVIKRKPSIQLITFINNNTDFI